MIKKSIIFSAILSISLGAISKVKEKATDNLVFLHGRNDSENPIGMGFYLKNNSKKIFAALEMSGMSHDLKMNSANRSQMIQFKQIDFGLYEGVNTTSVQKGFNIQCNSKLDKSSSFITWDSKLNEVLIKIDSGIYNSKSKQESNALYNYDAVFKEPYLMGVPVVTKDKSTIVGLIYKFTDGNKTVSYVMNINEFCGKLKN